MVGVTNPSKEWAKIICSKMSFKMMFPRVLLRIIPKLDMLGTTKGSNLYNYEIKKWFSFLNLNDKMFGGPWQRISIAAHFCLKNHTSSSKFNLTVWDFEKPFLVNLVGVYRREGMNVNKHTSHPFKTKKKLGPPIALLLNHLKWLYTHKFGVFTTNFGVSPCYILL